MRTRQLIRTSLVQGAPLGTTGALRACILWGAGACSSLYGRYTWQAGLYGTLCCIPDRSLPAVPILCLNPQVDKATCKSLVEKHAPQDPLLVWTLFVSGCWWSLAIDRGRQAWHARRLQGS